MLNIKNVEEWYYANIKKSAARFENYKQFGQTFFFASKGFISIQHDHDTV
jgi:hypothetical protein